MKAYSRGEPVNPMMVAMTIMGTVGAAAGVHGLKAKPHAPGVPDTPSAPHAVNDNINVSRPANDNVVSHQEALPATGTNGMPVNTDAVSRPRPTLAHSSTEGGPTGFAGNTAEHAPVTV